MANNLLHSWWGDWYADCLASVGRKSLISSVSTSPPWGNAEVVLMLRWLEQSVAAVLVLYITLPFVLFMNRRNQRKIYIYIYICEYLTRPFVPNLVDGKNGGSSSHQPMNCWQLTFDNNGTVAGNEKSCLTQFRPLDQFYERRRLSLYLHAVREYGVGGISSRVNDRVESAHGVDNGKPRRNSRPEKD